MNITIGITESAPYTEFDIQLELSAAEKTLFVNHNVPIPGDGSTTRDLFRKCFSSHGDFFRIVGIRNFRPYKPDDRGFASAANSGWQTFMNRLVLEADRDETLNTIAYVFINKIRLLTKKINPVVVTEQITTPRPIPITVSLTDLPEKPLRLQIGNKLFGIHEVTEMTAENALVQSAITDIESRAIAQLEGHTTDYAENLVLMKQQYTSEVRKLKDQVKNNLPALAIPDSLLAQHVQYLPYGSQYELFIPILVHYKYVTTPWHIWELKKEWQHKQNAILQVRVTINKDTYLVGHLYVCDKDFQDTVPLWHVMDRNELCLGTYEPKMKQLSDIIQIRNDMQRMLEKINTDSMSKRNLCDKQNELRELIETVSFKEFDDLEDGRKDMDLSGIAVLKMKKEDGDGVWKV